MEESNTQVLVVKNVDIPVKQDTMLEQISRTDGRCEGVKHVPRLRIDIRKKSQMVQPLVDGGHQGQVMIIVILVVKEAINTKTSQE